MASVFNTPHTWRRKFVAPWCYRRLVSWCRFALGCWLRRGSFAALRSGSRHQRKRCWLDDDRARRVRSGAPPLPPATTSLCVHTPRSGQRRSSCTQAAVTAACAAACAAAFFSRLVAFSFSFESTKSVYAFLFAVFSFFSSPRFLSSSSVSGLRTPASCA